MSPTAMGSDLHVARAHFERFAGITGEPYPIRDPITACMRADAHARGLFGVGH